MVNRVERHQHPISYELPNEDYKPIQKKQQPPGWNGQDVLTQASPQPWVLTPPQISNLKGSNEKLTRVIQSHQILLGYQHLLDNLIEATNDENETDLNLLDQKSKEILFGKQEELVKPVIEGEEKGEVGLTALDKSPINSSDQRSMLVGEEKGESDFELLDQSARETLVERLFLQCTQAQKEIGEEDALVLNDVIKRNQKATKEIRTLYFNAVDDQLKKVSDEKKLETAATILNALMISGAILTLTSTVMTGNVPAALIILNGAVAIASGGISIAQAELEKQSKQLISLLLELTTKRDLLGQKLTKEHMRELKRTLDSVLDLYSQQRTMLDQQYATSQQIWR